MTKQSKKQPPRQKKRAVAPSSNENKNNTIFVQIAAYRDPQLIPTLKELINNAANPSALNITVCWRHGDDESLAKFYDAGFLHKSTETVSNATGNLVVHTVEFGGAHIQLIDIDYNKTHGCCWARNAIQQFYRDEKYTLQLDSHHRVVKHYDKILIDMLEGLREKSPLPVLTAYLPSFDPDNDPDARVRVPWKMNFDRFIPEGAVFFIPGGIDDWQARAGVPMRARFYSAHFAFADGSFAKTVRHDPLYFFHGEEISISARAYTHGYDLYHPTIVVAWHEYTRKGRKKVWDDHTTTQKNNGVVDLDWVERNDVSHLRNRTLFGMDGIDPNSINFGKYGFGTARTLRQYEEYAGISFKYRGVQQLTLNKSEPPNNFEYSTEAEWKASFVRSNDIRICFHKNELGTIESDYDFWYVGCHDENGVEIYRKDAQVADIERYLANDVVDFRFIFLDDRIPKTYTVWTHSITKGWGHKLVKPVDAH